MSLYENTFKKIINENGAGYVPSAPNTSGSGGAFGNAASIGAAGCASGTPGTDTYATGDFRMPGVFGAYTRKGKIKKKKKKK
jgi:hypothetical protein